MSQTPSLKTPAEIVALARATVPTCSPQEAAQRLNNDPRAVLVDVRTAAEYESGHVDGARHVPRGLLEWKIAEACPEASTPILVHCASGGRAVLAARTLVDLGYRDVTAVDGSFADLQACLADN